MRLQGGLDFCVELYLQGHDPRDPLASPLHADLAGFPPLLVQVGSRERLLSDSTRFAAKADAAGVDVRLEVYDGCMHLWQSGSGSARSQGCHQQHRRFRLDTHWRLSALSEHDAEQAVGIAIPDEGHRRDEADGRIGLFGRSDNLTSRP